MSDGSAGSKPTLTCVIHDVRGGPSAAELVDRLKVAFGEDYVVVPVDQTSSNRAEGRMPVVLRLRLDAKTATTVAEASQPGIVTGRALKMLVQCELLDLHGVSNGDKAIDIALSRYWSQAHIDTYGPHDHPASIKRWRIERGSPGRRSLRAMELRRDARADRRGMPVSVRGIRRRYAQEVVRTGSSMREGYDRAISMANRSAQGVQDPSAGRVDFSYATFRRDCLAEADRVGGSNRTRPWPNRRCGR